MRIAYIISEYNPLHNGHIYQMFQTKKELNCDAIVCVMSGDIVQRGEIAVMDKYTRATWAIKSGADMVVEIPSKYVLGSAQIYATGAIKVIDYFKGEKYLSFGSECGNLSTLEIINSVMKSEEFTNILKHFISQGNTYAKANSLAFKQVLENHQLDTKMADILNEPNNILALEYLKALPESIFPFTVKREGSYKNSLSSFAPAATSIRECLENKCDNDYKSCVPPFVYNSLKNYISSKEKLFSIVKYELSKKTNLDKIYGMNEGINNRFLAMLKNSNSYDEYLNRVKTKRFTMTSLNRALLSALVDNTNTFENLENENIDYINVLAIREGAKELLSIIDTEVVTKPSDMEKQQITDPLSKKVSDLFKSVKYDYDSYMRII